MQEMFYHNGCLTMERGLNYHVHVVRLSDPFSFTNRLTHYHEISFEIEGRHGKYTAANKGNGVSGDCMETWPGIFSKGVPPPPQI